MQVQNVSRHTASDGCMQYTVTQTLWKCIQRKTLGYLVRETHMRSKDKKHNQRTLHTNTQVRVLDEKRPRDPAHGMHTDYVVHTLNAPNIHRCVHHKNRSTHTEGRKIKGSIGGMYSSILRSNFAAVWCSPSSWWMLQEMTAQVVIKKRKWGHL